MNSVRDSLLQALAAGPPARFVAIFGSTAKGTHTADSDLDIAWQPKDPQLSLAEELQFQAALTAAAGREVDLVRIDQASTLCRKEVAVDGELLAGSRDEWVRFRAAAIDEFLDFEPAFRAASERYRRWLASGRESAKP